MEDDLVSIVVVHIACQGSLQLEGNVVADVVVSGILPVGAASVGGIVDVLDLLLEFGNVGLVGDLEGALVGQLQQSQVVDGVGCAFFKISHVNDQVVTSVQRGGAIDAVNASGCDDMIVSDLCESFCVFALISPTGEDFSHIGSSLALCEDGTDLLVGLQVSQESIGVNAAAPGDVTQSCIVLRLSTGENLVSLVGVTGQVSFCCENGSSQSEDHDQGQQDAGDLSHVFHIVRFLSVF